MNELKRISNGWYVFSAFDNQCGCSMTFIPGENQAVQVIEGMVWTTVCINEITVKEAKKYGKFIRRIDINKRG